MQCNNCKNQLDNNGSKSYILLPCCDTICDTCINNYTYDKKCIKCNSLVTSKVVKKSLNQLQITLGETTYQNKYKEICFIGSGSFGCVYIVQDIENKNMYSPSYY